MFARRCFCVRSRPQPSATVRNRRKHDCVGTYGECCNSGHFWRFQMLRNLVSPGRRGTLWHPNMFHNMSRVVLCGGRNTFAMFSEDDFHFRGRHSTLETSMLILQGRRSTFDVSCCVFFANRIVRAASRWVSVYQMDPNAFVILVNRISKQWIVLDCDNPQHVSTCWIVEPCRSRYDWSIRIIDPLRFWRLLKWRLRVDVSPCHLNGKPSYLRKG